MRFFKVDNIIFSETSIDYLGEFYINSQDSKKTKVIYIKNFGQYILNDYQFNELKNKLVDEKDEIKRGQ